MSTHCRRTEPKWVSLKFWRQFNWRSNNATFLMQLFFTLSTFPLSTVTADEQQTDDNDYGTVQSP